MRDMCLKKKFKNLDVQFIEPYRQCGVGDSVIIIRRI